VLPLLSLFTPICYHCTNIGMPFHEYISVLMYLVLVSRQCYNFRMENSDIDKTFRGVEWKTWLEKTNKASASLPGFAKTLINPTMQAQENKTQFQVTMINIYGRMIL
jgi:hypothetical protein